MTNLSPADIATAHTEADNEFRASLDEAAKCGRYHHRMAAEASAIATANGFETTTWENLPAKLLFVFTELDEAFDYEREDNLPEELADTAIRLLAIIHELNPDWCSRLSTCRELPRHRRRQHREMSAHLWPIVSKVAKAAEAWRKGREADTKILVELALLEVWRCADRLGIHLDYAIEMKIAKNRRRPYLHGKATAKG